MPWNERNIGKVFKSGAGGNRYWVTDKNYHASIDGQHDSVKCEAHVTINKKEIDEKTKNISEFHVKFDDGRNLRVFFYFKESGAKASLDSGKSTKEDYAKRTFNVGKGEFAEMRAKAIDIAKIVSGQLQGK